MAGITHITTLDATISLASIIIGLCLLAFGLRGKRLDDHPVCRKCRYDLTGSPEAELCPECGTLLSGKRAVRIGNHNRRNSSVIIGLLFIVLGAFALTTQLYRTNLNPYKPYWLIKLEATTPALDSKGEALDEILRRIRNGSLSVSQLDALLVTIQNIQSDLTIPVDRTWTDIYVELLGKGVGTQSQHSQFKAAMLYSDSVTASQIEAATHVDRFVINRNADLTRKKPGHAGIDLRWTQPRPPFRGSFYNQVTVRTNGKEWPTEIHISGINPSHFGANVSTEWWGDIASDRVDLIFRPEPDAAMNQAKLYRILDHEFVIKDVEVVRQP